MGNVRLSTGVFVPNCDMAFKSSGTGQAGLPDGWTAGAGATDPQYWDSMIFGGYRSPGVVQAASFLSGMGRSLRMVVPTGRATDYTRYVQSPRSRVGEFFGADQMAPGNLFQDYFKYQVMARLRVITNGPPPSTPSFTAVLQTTIGAGDAMPKVITLNGNTVALSAMATNAHVQIGNEFFVADTPTGSTIRLTARAQEGTAAAAHAVNDAVTIFNWHTNWYLATTVVDASSGRTKEICPLYFGPTQRDQGWLSMTSALSTLDNTGWTGSGTTNPTHCYHRLYAACNDGPQAVYCDVSLADVVMYSISPIDLMSETSSLANGMPYYELTQGINFDDTMGGPKRKRFETVNELPSGGLNITDQSGNITKRRWKMGYRLLQWTDYQKLSRLERASCGIPYDPGSNVGKKMTMVLIPNLGDHPGMDHAYYAHLAIDIEQYDGGFAAQTAAANLWQGDVTASEM